jgi:hypothetical protein
MKLIGWIFVFGYWFLAVGHWSTADAMGSPPPATKEAEPKYKLEILNVDVISPAQTLESKTENATNEAEPKYKLEILKMDVIPASSPESNVHGQKE